MPEELVVTVHSDWPEFLRLSFVNLTVLLRGGVFAYSRLVKSALARAVRGEAKRVHVRPHGDIRGHVLLSYITRPFVDQRAEAWHSEDWEVRQMAITFAQLGYAVEIIDHRNHAFAPQKNYDFVIDVRRNLERLLPRLNPDCTRVFHATTAQIDFHNAAELRRIEALRQRRGVALPACRWEPPFRGLEIADCGTTTGNGFTQETYRDIGRPMHRVRVSPTIELPWDEQRDFDAGRRNFLWLGSGGMVHKGLDLVLEAFAAMPEMQLTIFGPVAKEPDFVAAYAKELQAPNIHLRGCVAVKSPEFQTAAGQCVGTVFASCSEGGGGSLVNCLQAGLIPIATREASVDIDDSYGVLLPDASVGAIQRAVRQIAALPAEQLRAMSRRAWEFAQANHTRAHFAEDYEQVARTLIAGRESRTRAVTPRPTSAQAA